MVALWMLPNFYPEFGLIWFDPPPFELLLTLSIIALPMTVGVLIKQTGKKKLAAGAAEFTTEPASAKNC